MKKIILAVFIMISSISYSFALIGTDIGNLAPAITAEGLEEGSHLGKITVLKFWQST